MLSLYHIWALFSAILKCTLSKISILISFSFLFIINIFSRFSLPCPVDLGAQCLKEWVLYRLRTRIKTYSAAFWPMQRYLKAGWDGEARGSTIPSRFIDVADGKISFLIFGNMAE